MSRIRVHARVGITFLLAAFLLGCPPPPIAHFYNGSSSAVQYCSGWRCVEVSAGAIEEVRITYSEPFRFKLRVANQELRYSITQRVPVAFARRQPDSSCPNCPRYYLQLEPDLEISILEPELDPPAQPGLQPPGFPLSPERTAA